MIIAACVLLFLMNGAILWFAYESYCWIVNMRRSIHQLRIDTDNSLNKLTEQLDTITHAIQNNTRDDADQEDADWWKQQ